MIDTHTHLYLDDYNPDKCAAIDRALAAGIELMVLPGVDAGSIPQIRELYALRPEAVVPCAGLHPTDVLPDSWRVQFEAVETELRNRQLPYVAVGEAGLDLYWDKTHLSEQLDALDAQTALADELGLPLIIHCREALPQLLDLMEGRRGRLPQAVFHSFGGSEEDLARIRRLMPDAMFGINGIVTFKNSKLREVLPAIGTSHLVLETDAPWLAPVPMRGRQNESAYMVHTATHIAAHLGMTTEQLDAVTTANARSLFRL
ncbi:MAG: TatD family hydrolase [Muribaculaceae bacterium]|nr:TatD family hydrolase [Muribaculaceae bacterium]